MTKQDYLNYYRPNSFHISMEYCMVRGGNPHQLQDYWVTKLDTHFEVVVITDKKGNLIQVK